ncbi:MAG: LacI family transcriptional regulator [Actinomycetota bacterium]|nr:LacI family transcriptional regulator [Actinomycetota bacterium]
MPPPPASRVTLKHVAQRAGVSQATASKVLNGRTDVSKTTRDRVLRVIDEEGYRRSSARATDVRRPQITAIFDGLTSQYASLILQGMVTAAAERDTDIVVRLVPTAFSSTSPAAARTWIHENASATGVIAVTSAVPQDVVRAASRLGLPLVTVDPVDPADSDVVSIGSTDWTGGRAVAEHLIDLGHTRIGWVGGLRGSVPSIERFQGYRSALENAGLTADPSLHRSGPYSFEAGVELGGQLLDQEPRPTAIIGASDAIAFGITEAARQRGLDLPGDLSVAGFDDIPQAEWTSPKLTSVRTPLIGIGRMATETLFAMSEGREPASHHIQLSTRLIVRESTAPPRGATASEGSSQEAAAEATSA